MFEKIFAVVFETYVQNHYTLKPKFSEKEPEWLKRQPFFWAINAHVIAMSLVVWNPLLFFWLTRKQKRSGLSKILNSTEVSIVNFFKSPCIKFAPSRVLLVFFPFSTASFVSPLSSSEPPFVFRLCPRLPVEWVTRFGGQRFGETILTGTGSLLTFKKLSNPLTAWLFSKKFCFLVFCTLFKLDMGYTSPLCDGARLPRSAVMGRVLLVDFGNFLEIFSGLILVGRGWTNRR